MLHFNSLFLKVDRGEQTRKMVPQMGIEGGPVESSGRKGYI